MSRASIVSRIAHASCAKAPNLIPEDPWWEALAPDFYKEPEPFELSAIDRIRVGSTAAADVVLRTLGAALVGTLALPVGYHPWKLAALRRDTEIYRDLADQGDPDAVFPRPAPGVEVKRRRPWRPTFRPRDGKVVDLTFRSRFEPISESVRKSYLRHRANRTAHARHWFHDKGRRPTIIAVHGFSADLYFLNQWFFAIPWLYRLGCDVLLVTLPFHGPRQTRFSPFSGYGFFAGGVQRINEAFAHAIHDLRVFMDFLRAEHQTTEIGITGVSLGGFTSALLASLEPSLAFAVPNVPVVSLADLVFEWEPMGSVVRAASKARGMDITELRHMLAPTCPLTWKPAIPRDQLMIISGVADRLAPPKHSRLLWEHWDRCRMHWFPGSHLVHLDKGNYLRQMAKFLASLEFIAPRDRGR